jgi:hypothetical protein
MKKLQVIKKINELKTKELHLLLKTTFPDLPDFFQEDIIINYERNGDDGYVIIESLGYTLIIWNDYSIELFSEFGKRKSINLINTINCLTEIGALSFI